MTLIIPILVRDAMPKSCANENVTSALLHQSFQSKKKTSQRQRDFSEVAFRVLVTKNRVFVLTIILFIMIIENASDIEPVDSPFFIAPLIYEFSDVTIDVLNELKRMMSVSNDVVLNCCREI